jgi:hypothetical protein
VGKKKAKTRAKTFVVPKDDSASKALLREGVENAVTEAMKYLDDQHYASSRVSQSETVQFYQGIEQECRDRREIILREIADSKDGKDDDYE